MTVPDLDHPAVAGYVHRLTAAAATLPPGHRDELVADIRAHLEDALAGVPDQEGAVLEVLDRLGTPEDIVAAADLPDERGARAAAMSPPAGSPPPPAGAAPPPTWTALEVIAVLALTAGTFVLPVVGPLIGLVLAWTSTRWHTRDKAIATVLTLLQPMLLVLALLAGLALAGGSASGVVPVPATGVVSPVPSPTSAPRLPTPPSP